MDRFVPQVHAAGDVHTSLIFAFNEAGDLLLAAGDVPRLPPAEVIEGAAGIGVRIHMGRMGPAACVAAAGPETAPEGCCYRGLRELLTTLDEGVLGLAGRARQLLAWDRDHRFCGRCGVRTEDKEGERAKVCPACGHTVFPRINPAVIVAVLRGDRLLLARNGRFRGNMHSLVAGFVEAGETLEETLHREVEEEVGIRIDGIRYIRSQAWPFPSTLMLGFTAQHAGGEIRVDGMEIVEAGWYGRDGLPPIPAHGSLSRFLIDTVLGLAPEPAPAQRTEGTR
ncbi:MAG: NAD(+) diphosphatase [Lentisphaeria bacterium]|nr:NAD(+) diphosphatase [Lentisphaeria bacterium]